MRVGIAAALAAAVAMAGFVVPAGAEGSVPASLPSYPQVEVSLPGGVRGLSEITYRTVQGFRPLRLDLYLPPLPRPAGSPVAGLPLVVFIHGGAWLAGDRRVGAPFLGFLTALAMRGTVVASIDYRLSGEARFPAQIEDVEAAIRFLRDGADGHLPAGLIDPARIVTWGESAGGLLAALAATACGSPDPTRTMGGCVRGAVAWYGVFDMTTIAEQARLARAWSREVASAPEWRLLGCVGAQCSPDLLRLASPAAAVGPATPPMLLVTGDADRIVPSQQSVEMAARLGDAGIAHELMLMPGLDHSLAGRTAEESLAANLKAFAATLRFIERTIGSAKK